MDKEDFIWKDPKDIWKGVGIYHLTFVVAGRRSLLGELVAEHPDVDFTTVERSTDINAIVDDSAYIEEHAKIAKVKLTPYGKAVDDMLRHYDENHEGITVCKRIVMDNHLHIILWVKNQLYSTVQHKPQSILQIAYGMRVQFTHMAQDMGVWPKGVRKEGALHSEKGVGHVFEKQFVRTLSRKGQLRSMIDYVVLNPYRKYMIQQHPELFTIHKDTEVRGLRFRSMGNHWLLNWPERQIVQCSRSISEENLQQQLKQTLEHAERGAITFTAAISKGEQMIARAVREAGWPLIVLLMDGFPPEGSESNRYYKPGGVYFETCNTGKLLLLEAYDETYETTLLIERTNAAIKAKDEAKGYAYRALPHNSKRWRMIAGNVMLEMMCEQARAQDEHGWVMR